MSMVKVHNIPKEADYLRISVTDRCNLRCVYCMPPGGIEAKPYSELLSFEEILRLVKVFVRLGITKIRLTGGEPLLRRGILDLLTDLCAIEGIEEVNLTTNGSLLSQYVEGLKKARVNRINVSLDTLIGDRFRRFTGSDILNFILEGIERALKASFQLKLNVVVMRGLNDDEIYDFIEFAKQFGIIVRFIEFMKITPLWRSDYFISAEEIKKICEKRYRLILSDYTSSGPAIYYEIPGICILGFIKNSLYNCAMCTRLRLTSTGELKLCLYEKRGIFLKQYLRDGFTTDEELINIINSRLNLKGKINHIGEDTKIYMCALGG